MVFSTKDDPALVQIALKRSFILKDDVRECRYAQSQSSGESIISVLRAKGHLDENEYIHLFRIHADYELRRAVKELTESSPQALGLRLRDAFAEAKNGLSRQARSRKARLSEENAPETVLVCPNCTTKYNASKLAPGTPYKCRRCGNTIEVPDYRSVLEIEPDIDMEEALDVEGLVGEVVGGCKILELIGKGGMGVVYRGKHLTLDRDVAIKVLARERKSDFFRDQFLAESRAAAKLIHPNVVQVFDAGEAGRHPYIVMEFVEGATVKQLINTRKRLSLVFIKRVVSEAAQGLSAAHRMKLVHRDVKPENIMISFTGDTKVMDFGLAKDTGARGDASKAGLLIGTPFYMAPEQFMTDAEVDHRTDIYALGITLYHMLTGRPPFTGDSPYKIMNAHLNERHTPIREIVPEVPEELEAIVDKMLVKDRTRRYQSMGQIVKDLEQVKLPE